MTENLETLQPPMLQCEACIQGVDGPALPLGCQHSRAVYMQYYAGSPLDVAQPVDL